jgi:hypothetical protein
MIPVNCIDDEKMNLQKVVQEGQDSTGPSVLLGGPIPMALNGDGAVFYRD